MGLIKEFREFAMRGNVVDMAVGIIVGGAFGKITSSLVSDVIMPPVGMIVGGVDFSSLAVTLQPATENHAAVKVSYGLFLNTVIDFIIISFVIFLLIKGLNALRREQPAAAAPPPPSREVVLLTEIRDALRAR